MITADNSALVIIDIQGKLSTLMHDKHTLFQQTQRTIKAAGLLDIPILWAEQVPDKLGPTAVEIAQLLTEHQPIVKSTFSCCSNTAFIDALDQLDKQYLIITGIETHICVYQTVSALLKQGKHTHVLADATSSRTPDNKRIGLNRMQAEGAVISSLEMCLFEMIQHVQAAQFREISQLLR